MPPKKKSAAKTPKNKGGAIDSGAELNAQDLARRAALRIESLERQLLWREEKMNHAIEAQKELRERISVDAREFAQEREDHTAITAEMTRRYAQMQEELLAKSGALETRLSEQKRELDEARLRIEEERRGRAEERMRKEDEILDHKHQMDDMAHEFGEMLKETLAKLGAELEREKLPSDGVKGDAAFRGRVQLERLDEHRASVNAVSFDAIAAPAMA